MGPPDCFCFDLCPRGDPFANDNGEEFVARTRGVMITNPASPWITGYLGAVYNGRAPVPFNLSRLHFFHLNTPAWRAKHPRAFNPFRDCQRRHTQAQCDWHQCTALRAELRDEPDWENFQTAARMV
jgi:hypothetical protein